jgi:hypothetical protein
VDIQAISISIAAIAAISAAASARFSKRAVERNHTPFVWPSISIRSVGGPESRQHEVGVRLHNDGSGAAFRVRFAIATNESLAFPEGLYSPPPIRAIRPGEAVPPASGIEEQLVQENEYRIGLSEPLDSDWYVVTRYSDDLGRLWELRASSDPHSGLLGPTPLRRRRWEIWRAACDW